MTEDRQFPSWEEFRAARRAAAAQEQPPNIIVEPTVPTEPEPLEYSHSYTDFTEDLRQARTKKICLIVLIIAVAGAFAGLFIKFTLDRTYVDQQLATISTANDQAFADLNERLAAIETEMGAISSTLDETGNSIDSSGQQTRQAMQNQITALNQELSELKQSLEILKESKGI